MAVVFYNAGKWSSSAGGGTVEAGNTENTQNVSWGSGPVGHPFFVTIDGAIVWSSYPNAVHGTGSGGYPDVVIVVVGDACNSITNVDDKSDLPKSPPCSGIAVWRVSEPYQSLWLHKEPLGYQPAIGPRISFELAYKQRDTESGLDPSIFSVGKKWSFRWLSYVAQDANQSNVVCFPGGGQRTFYGTNDYLTSASLSGNTNDGFTLSYPDGSKDVYGFIVTNNSGTFLKAFMTERYNSIGQRTRLEYANYKADPNPVVRLNFVEDGDGRANSISYVSANGFSTNLVSQIADPFGRTATLEYDQIGRLTNVTGAAGISSAFVYDLNDWVTNLVTPYGQTAFTITDTSGTNVVPNGRSILVTEPDGGHQLYMYKDSAPGVVSKYTSGEIASTSPFTNRFDNTELHFRNTFHWGLPQYAALSTTTISAFTSNDFRKARMRHWLKSGYRNVGETLSLERAPSPDAAGNTEGQKTWFDYPGKPHGAYEGTSAFLLHAGLKLPDGSTAFTRTVRNSFGNVLMNVSTYSSNGAVALRTNIYSYASNGIDLLTTTNALGVLVSSNAYNAYHQVLTNFNALGEKTVFTYNTNRQLVQVRYPSDLTVTKIYFTGGDYVNWLEKTIDLEIGRTNSLTYSDGLVRTSTDARSQTVTYTWDALQRLRRLDFADGTYVTNLYDKLDLVQVTDRLGYSSTMGYDAARHLVAETNANGVVSRYGYCDCGSLNSVTNAWNTSAQEVTQFAHDNQGNRTQVAYPDATVTNWYDALGRITTTGDGQGYRSFLYNNQGLVTNISNTLGGEQALVYDILDRPVYLTDANGVTVTNTFDNLNRVLTRAYPGGAVEQFDYSARGLIAYTNQLGQPTHYGRDALGRVTAVTNANQEAVFYTYNPAGDLLTLKDGKGQLTTWNYDEYGRFTNKLDQAGVEILRYQFDANHRLTNRWSAAKGDTRYSYDAVGNLTNINYPKGTAVTFQYDWLDRLTNLTDTVGTTKFAYAVGGQLLSEDGPWSSDTVTNGYLNRLRTSLMLQQPTGTWTNGFSYDAAWRLTNVTSQAGSFDYLHAYASPLPLKVSLPNTSYITNNYDALARLLGTWLKKNDQTTLNSHEYAYTPANQRTQQVFNAGSIYNYAYDPIGQLKVADSATASEDRGYTYDTAWNLNYRTNNGALKTFKVNTKNELTNATVAGTQIYDADGNLTFSDLTWQAYNYDDENQLVNWYYYGAGTNGNGEPTSWDDLRTDFIYDGLGRLRKRVEYWAGGFTWGWSLLSETCYLYDGMRVIQERNSGNTPTVSYTRGTDLSGSLEGARGTGGLLARSHGNSGGNWSTHNFYHADGNGNITYLVNSSQSLAAKYRYDPYGNTISSSGTLASANVYRFSSKEQHVNSGLYYYGERFYSTSLQRWLNRDPLGDLGSLVVMTAGLLPGPASANNKALTDDEVVRQWTAINGNLYTYVNNNPLNRIDPFGLEGLASPSASMNSDIARGDASAIENLLTAIGEELSSAARQAAQAALKKPRSECEDLVRGSLKRSKCYHSELENKTYEELLKDSSKAAKQMRKLIDESRQLMEKNK